MSFWSGVAAAGVAFVIAFVALGEPVWEYETRDAGGSESWSYSAFVAHQTVYDSATGVTTFRNYSYDQLAGLPAGRAQPNMARVFGEFQQLMIGSLVAASAGIALAIVSKWKRLRGIFAGFGFLGACALTLFAIFTIAFAIPVAASKDFGTTIPQISGGTLGGPSTASWQPWLGWYLPACATCQETSTVEDSSDRPTRAAGLPGRRDSASADGRRALDRARAGDRGGVPHRLQRAVDQTHVPHLDDG